MKAEMNFAVHGGGDALQPHCFLPGIGGFLVSAGGGITLPLLDNETNPDRISIYPDQSGV